MATQSEVTKSNALRNVAIIMDGNGRWAKSNALQVSKGHEKGVGVVREIVEESINQNIESLTLFAFSSENWGRPNKEISSIKKLIIKAIDDQLEDLINQKVLLSFFGDIEAFGDSIVSKINLAENTTKIAKPSLRLNIALGYGGQQDILNIIKKAAADALEKNISINSLDKDYIINNSCVPEESIDLLIRTGGDKRVSNFLLYQIAYAEIMFIDEYWPDFTKKLYIDLISRFKKVSRRFGKRV